MAGKTDNGNFFEDFSVGQHFRHATPRTLTEGDAALYTALYGSRFPIQSSDMAALQIGFEAAPLDDLLVFHTVFGRTVPDVSLNAIANLGYAQGQFGVPVYPGDTVSATSDVIGIKENSNGETGVVYVQTRGLNQRDEMACQYVRWAMVRKRDPASPAPEPVVPDLADRQDEDEVLLPDGLDLAAYDTGWSGNAALWDDYEVGEKIDHMDGMTVEEAEHMMATRLYQNTARVHFNQHAEKDGRFGRRIVYGGHIISIARALSFNGLGNAFKIAAIHAGTHAAPVFAGDTVYAWTEVLGKSPLPGRDDLARVRLRTVATKDHPCADFLFKDGDGRYHPAVVLDFDYSVLCPR